MELTNSTHDLGGTYGIDQSTHVSRSIQTEAFQQARESTSQTLPRYSIVLNADPSLAKKIKDLHEEDASRASPPSLANSRNVKQISKNEQAREKELPITHEDTPASMTGPQSHELPLGRYGAVARKQMEMKNKKKQKANRQAQKKDTKEQDTAQITKRAAIDSQAKPEHDLETTKATAITNELTQQITSIETELNKENQKLKNHKQEEYENAKIKECNDNIKEYEAKNNKLEEKINKLKKFSIFNKSKLNEIKNEIDSNKNAINLFKRRSKEIENNLKNTGKLTTEHATTSDVETRIATLEAQLQNATNQLSKIKNKVNE